MLERFLLAFRRGISEIIKKPHFEVFCEIDGLVGYFHGGIRQCHNDRFSNDTADVETVDNFLMVRTNLSLKLYFTAAECSPPALATDP